MEWLAQTGAEQAAALYQILFFLLMILIFYFIAYRPIRNERKRHEEMIKNLKKNDRVITQGGIYGVITNIQDRDVILRIDDNNNVKVRVLKSHIAAVVPKEEKQKEKK